VPDYKGVKIFCIIFIFGQNTMHEPCYLDILATDFTDFMGSKKDKNGHRGHRGHSAAEPQPNPKH
jgi:hypothetical protein